MLKLLFYNKNIGLERSEFTPGEIPRRPYASRAVVNEPGTFGEIYSECWRSDPGNPRPGPLD